MLHDHHSHDHGMPHAPPAMSETTASLNQLALSATMHCLTGCAIGEVLGLVIGTALGWGNALSILLAVVLAFIFGYSLTLWPLLAGGLAFRTAMGLALASDTLSITVMEIVDNVVMLVIPVRWMLGSPVCCSGEARRYRWPWPLLPRCR